MPLKTRNCPRSLNSEFKSTPAKSLNEVRAQADDLHVECYRSHRPGRPRSWDLSTMEVSGDSDSSAATCDAHNVANNMAAVVANSGNVAVVGGQAPSHLPGTSSSASEMVPKSSFASSPSPSLSSVEGPPYGTLRQPRKGPLGTAQLRGTVEGGHGTCPQQQQQQCKTLLTITGGCGYVNWRKAGVERDYGSTAASPSGDALVLIWEMKV